MSWLQKNKYNIVLLFSSILVCLIIVESYLRITIENPQSIKTGKKGNYFRLHNDQSAKYDIADLYGTEETLVSFRVRNNVIQSSKSMTNEPIYSVFLGGSTTESIYVPEGYRFPDLYSSNSANIGVSGNTLLDSVSNLKYLYSKQEFRNIKEVFVMHGVNDMATLTSTNHPNIISDINRLMEWHASKESRTTMQRARNIFKKSYIAVVLANYIGSHFKKEKVINSYKKEKRSNLSKSLMSEEEFTQWVKSPSVEVFFKNREKVFAELIDFCRKKGLKLYLLTQPDSFREDYSPSMQDLRLFFLINGKRASLRQSAQLMEMVNNHTRSVARKYGVTLIDVEASFLKSADMSQLFYDSFHYTKKGSIYLANCLRSPQNYNGNGTGIVKSPDL
jgi:UDP-N-acetylenolpyruvoylglucosamine reductase